MSKGKVSYYRSAHYCYSEEVKEEGEDDDDDDDDERFKLKNRFDFNLTFR